MLYNFINTLSKINYVKVLQHVVMNNKKAFLMKPFVFTHDSN